MQKNELKKNFCEKKEKKELAEKKYSDGLKLSKKVQRQCDQMI